VSLAAKGIVAREFVFSDIPEILNVQLTQERLALLLIIRPRFDKISCNYMLKHHLVIRRILQVEFPDDTDHAPLQVSV